MDMSSVSLLRADQIEEMEGEREGLRKKMHNPNIQDKGVVADQLRKLDNQLETQRPTEYGSDEIDAAVRKEAQLRAEWLDGMLSHEEMRKCPPGAVDRHLAWERKNAPRIEEWQNIMRRLNHGSDAREIASIERFRPTVSRMNMDNAIVAGKQYHLPPAGAAQGVPFTDGQLAALRSMFPEMAERIATLSNEGRAEVKAALTKAQIDGKKGVTIREARKAEKAAKAAKPKRVVSAEQLAALQAGRVRALEAKRAAQAQPVPSMEQLGAA